MKFAAEALLETAEREASTLMNREKAAKADVSTKPIPTNRRENPLDAPDARR